MLNTFGAILSFAVELEGATQSFYAQCLQHNLSDPELIELLENYASKSGKRKQRLIAIRQDNVTEMILEPISGLDIADYEPALRTFAASVDSAIMLLEAVRLEALARRFYEDAAPKLNVTEARRAFQKFAQENDERAMELNKANATLQQSR